MKICCKCKTEKPLSEFSKNKTQKSGYASWCKRCMREYLKVYKKQYYQDNREHILKVRKQYYNSNIEYEREYHRKYYQENHDRILKSKKIYRDNNRGYILAYFRGYRKANPDCKKKHYYDNKASYYNRNAKRRAAKLKAIPSWTTQTDINRIKSIYDMCSRLNKQTKISWHVDHIIPLQGKNVCGLHVPENLQILTAQENLEKGNSFNAAF